MSAPDTNMSEQTRKHRAPLAGMALVALFAAGLLLMLLFRLAANGNTPEDDGPQVQVVPGVGATLESDG